MDEPEIERRREIVEVPSVLLPCGHLTDRPTGSSESVLCHCGKMYKLTWDRNGTWNISWL